VGFKSHRAELRVLVQGADVLTSPTHRHSVAWLSPQKVVVARRLIVLVTVQGPCSVELHRGHCSG
jgi:hypothetical protein